MSKYKTVQKKFLCALTNEIVLVGYTYEQDNELGHTNLDFSPSGRRCQRDQQCHEKDLLYKCPLTEIPLLSFFS